MHASPRFLGIFLCSGLLFSVGCGDSNIQTTLRDADAGKIERDTSEPADTFESPDVVDIVEVPDIDYLTCVLNEAAPWDACEAEEILAFGTVDGLDTVMRRMRLDNQGASALQVTQASIDDANFTVVARTYSQEDPPVASEVTLPADLPAGTSLFLEVSVRDLSGGQALAFDADSLEILLDTGADTPETVSIAITGDYGTCGAGFADCDDDARNGCEANLASDPLHCGVCRNACSAENGEAVCSAGQCGTTCEVGFQDCDSDPLTGCETDIYSVDNCGGCGVVCAFANASAQCGGGSCAFDACAPGWMDLNAEQSDGCEYECTKQSDHDLPDVNGIDANCDGIDGVITRGVFVATSGSDTTGAGTLASPYQSIGYAITVASQVSGLDHIYVAAGDYDEQVTLFNGVSIFGGYDATANWARNTSHITRIAYTGQTGRKIAVRGTDITSPTNLGMLTISTDSVTSGNGNNTALYCKGCSALIIQNSTFSPGDAGNGTNGTNGAAALGAGSVGAVGQNGRTNSTTPTIGGAGGSSQCGRTGGRGGNGGIVTNQGNPGGTGVASAAGGSGGPHGAAGGNGAYGRAPTDGQHGAGGMSGSVVAGFWQAINGVDGIDGTHGNGGGGGGGGGGYFNGFAINSGGAGGGGGGGGCQGHYGTAGTSGGSVFALFLLDSSGITLSNNTIIGAKGGDGGNGGAGSAGSAGAVGRSGGSAAGSSGRGGAGGNGSRGGNGGHGGGGAGGNSYGVFLYNTTPNASLPGNNTFVPGLGGQGGVGGNASGNAGANGVTVNF